jgi:hypothetical protein
MVLGANEMEGRRLSPPSPHGGTRTVMTEPCGPQAAGLSRVNVHLFIYLLQSQHVEIDRMKDPEGVKAFAARGKTPGPEALRWEIVDRRPWRAHSGIVEVRIGAFDAREIWT